MIGKDSSGRRLPGGPYTLYQLGGGLVCAVTLKVTAAHWGVEMAILAKFLVAVIVVATVVLLLGRIDVSSANPLYQASGLFPAMIRSSSPRTGLRGRRLRVPSKRRRAVPSGRGPASLASTQAAITAADTPVARSSESHSADVTREIEGYKADDACTKSAPTSEEAAAARPLQPLAQTLSHASTTTELAEDEQYRPTDHGPTDHEPTDDELAGLESSPTYSPGVSGPQGRLSPLEQFLAAANLTSSRQDR